MDNNTNSTNKKALLSLAIGGFGIGLTEFVIMGILPNIAESMEISISKAGHFIAIYALGVVIGAPVMARVTHTLTPKKTLLFLMLWFTVFNTLSSFSGNYWTMMLFRFLSGMPHGAFFGIGAVVSGYLAKPGKAAQAMAVMFSGLTVANMLGVPLGTYIGQEFHWMYSFLLVGIAGIATLSSLYFWMPVQSLEETGTDVNKSATEGLKNKKLWALIALTTIGTGGFFAWYSYIAPLVINVTKLPEANVGYVMIVAGAGMFVGNFLGARMVEIFPPVKSVVISLLSMTTILLCNALFATSGIAVYIISFIVGVITFSVTAPIQIAIIKAAKGAEKLGSSMNQSAFNMGNASGAYLGGLPMVFGLEVTYASVVGSILALIGGFIGISIFVTQKKLDKKRGTSTASS
ncbi:MFS transporter [Flagellimonas zhangzhouensis]|uniref:MFS transporter, DHA1 family, arabinose polymer transporter n=1 Tax=Flagellimonas zhangzhouensis TaxID=1073328 RepID=A0A1H2VTL8_9FLAO|nr:MFS transporter [Allomuricauda zhangzhouensis]SDQ05710.1 MFS transporter, DHA1 family, arabinose polymer transporter [Allomuricauda zhangzhouensis]SDW71693.1 MFS transporter, DHA1 family, arabinose polymer transporter [Allomuricauda zhangzhouensis]